MIDIFVVNLLDLVLRVLVILNFALLLEYNVSWRLKEVGSLVVLVSLVNIDSPSVLNLFLLVHIIEGVLEIRLLLEESVLGSCDLGLHRI